MASVKDKYSDSSYFITTFSETISNLSGLTFKTSAALFKIRFLTSLAALSEV